MKRRAGRSLLILWILCTILLAASSGRAAPAGGTLASIEPMGRNASVAVFKVTYWSDGLRVKGRLFWPDGANYPPPPDAAAARTGAARLAAIVFNHDGVSGISKWTSLRAAQLADAGYAVFAPSFRGEDGSEGTIEVAYGEVDDVINAARLLALMPGVDGHRVGVVGMSHGALISVLAAQRSKLFRCVVEAYGVMDIFKWWHYLKSQGYSTDDALSARVYGKGPIDRPAAFHARNAVEHLKGLHVPLLVLHGSIDKTVPAQQATLMAQACKNQGKVCELHLYKGAQHGFLVYGGSEPTDPPAEVAGQRAAWNDMLRFLKRWV